MPQLVPFYFVNQASLVFIILFITIYMFTKYFLPNNLSLYVTRNFINQL
uniref:ATP synthase protein 8 n=1 Tax=Arthonia cupressina TaxID=2563722 RepID=A0A4P8VVI3_9PEZI|nr:ATP synthase subunit 8 [Arthonia cupressina]